jgi:hypothetical protein
MITHWNEWKRSVWLHHNLLELWGVRIRGDSSMNQWTKRTMRWDINYTSLYEYWSRKSRSLPAQYFKGKNNQIIRFFWRYKRLALRPNKKWTCIREDVVLMLWARWYGSIRHSHETGCDQGEFCFWTTDCPHAPRCVMWVISRWWPNRGRHTPRTALVLIHHLCKCYLPSKSNTLISKNGSFLNLVRH